MLEERQCELEGLPVRYRVMGSGPPAVLVHGLAGSWRWWRGVVEPLADSLRLHLIDLPGFGSARGRDFVLADAPSYVRALIAELDLGRAHLVGHSLGGAVCARVAGLWPELVDRLVLVAPAGVLARRRALQYAVPLASAFRRADPTFRRVLATDAVRAGALTVYRAARQLLTTEALRDELAAIESPTLLVWGDHDPLVPLDLARDYVHALPDARLAVLEGAGHVPMTDRPDEFARAVVEFCAATRVPAELATP